MFYVFVIFFYIFIIFICACLKLEFAVVISSVFSKIFFCFVSLPLVNSVKTKNRLSACRHLIWHYITAEGLFFWSAFATYTLLCFDQYFLQSLSSRAINFRHKFLLDFSQVYVCKRLFSVSFMYLIYKTWTALECGTWFLLMLL